ncbi:MAG: outer membrane protein assembly factor BamC, partial [Burkholderiaceae bacterium]
MTRSLTLPALAATAALTLGACSSLDGLMSGDKIDYRTNSSARTTGLEVPPDLTQLTRDSRYQQTGGAVSAAAYQAATPAAATVGVVAAATVAPQAAGDVRIERLGNQRWLRTGLTPEQLWPQLQAFWKERGFVLVKDDAAAGVMETDWAENRAKLPQDIIRSTIGKVFDNLYSTGEYDKFRTRVERSASGTEVYLTHRGMVETYTSNTHDQTVWQPRPADPQLEGEFLSRLMLKLGATEELAKTAVATPVAGVAPARARIRAGQPPATLQVDDGFDRAWRRVG